MRRGMLLACALTVLAGCAAGPRGAPESIDLALEEALAPEAPVEATDAAPSAATPAEGDRRLFRFLRRSNVEPPPDPSTASAAAEPPETEPEPSLTDEEIAARGTTEEEASTRPRLFGFLRKRVPGETETAPTPEPENTEQASTEPGPEAAPTPSLTDAEIAARGPEPEEASRRPRLFGLFDKRVPGNAGADVVLAAVPPQGEAAPPPPLDPAKASAVTAPARFGELRVMCGLKRRDLGKEVARSQGAGTYRLHDTVPNSTEPRLHYLTGFKDGCPREFVAALALFGSAQVHETKRYDAKNKAAYSETDEAYETAKRRLCGVKRGTRCPAGRYARLIGDVAFLTAYPSFGDTRPRMEIFASGARRTAVQVYD